MRKSLLLLAALSACALLTGCHGSKNSGTFEVPETFDEGKPIEITFWAKNDTNKTQTKIYEQAITDFEALYPNISVNLRLYTDYGKIYNDVITNIATRTTPNVCITYPDHIATYITGEGVVVPLDDLIFNEKYGLGGSEVRFDAPKRGEIIGEYLDECILDGSYYALPFMRSTEACYINRDFVEALGYEVPDVLTWDYIFEVSEAAAEKDAGGVYRLNGQKVMIPFIYKSTDNMMIQYLRQADAGYSTDKGGIEIFNDTTKEFLLDIAGHVKNGAFSTFKISGYPANFLNAGQCVFAIDSTAGATWMGSSAPLSDISPDKVVNFDTVVRPVPQLNPDSPKMISQGPSVCVFNKDDSDEVLASWLFAQYLLSNTVQIAYSETEGYVPVTSKARESEEYRDYLSRAGENTKLYYDVKIEASKMLLDHTSSTFTTPVFNGSTSLRNAAGQIIENVVKSVRRKETVDDAYLDGMFGEVTSLYRLDQIEARTAGAEGRKVLGPLPTASRVLIGLLIAAWALILLYVVLIEIRSRRRGA